MTRTHQWLLAVGIVLVIGGVVSGTMFGLRGELFPVDAGARAPEFEALTLFTRQKRTLDDYKGHVVLVNIWATWCPPCRQEMPSLEALYREYGPDGFKVVAINAADPTASDSTVRAFADQYGLTFDLLRDVPAPGRDSVTRTYRVTAFPESFVIDRDGVIRKKWAGADVWSSLGNRALIAQLLGLPVPSAGSAPDASAEAPLAAPGSTEKQSR
jgi:thiol-disulfide isomerase/thioredoxin